MVWPHNLGEHDYFWENTTTGQSVEFRQMKTGN